MKPYSNKPLFEQLESRCLLSGEPRLIKAIESVDGDATGPGNLAGVGETLFFNAGHPDTGRELWKSDGTEAGTVLVRDISPGPSSSWPRALTSVGGKLFFFADNPDGLGLWTSDGTEAGTVLVRHMAFPPQTEWPYGIPFVEAAGTVFFVGDDDGDGDGSVDHELWKTDGTAEGTVRVKDIWPGADTLSLSSLVPVGNMLYFIARNPTGRNELWKSDGTESGTVRVMGTDVSAARLHELQGAIYFIGSDATNQGLWTSDGTVEGTVLIREGNFRPTVGASVGHLLYFIAGGSPVPLGIQLWKSDGTTSGTAPLRDRIWDYYDLTDGSVEGSGTLYFIGNEGELWKSDGTEGGTVLVKGLVGRHFDDQPRELTSVNGTMYLSAFNRRNGRDLWRSDGTAGGTVMVTNSVTHPQVWGAYPKYLTNVRGTLYFVAVNETYGRDLWAISPPPGDVDRNHFVNAADIDAMFAAIEAGMNDAAFDLTLDQIVDHADLVHLVTEVLQTRFGDVNLDGRVDRADLLALARNYGQRGDGGWSDGDFNGDGVVGLRYLAILRANLNGDSPAPESAALRAVAPSARTVRGQARRLTVDEPHRVILVTGHRTTAESQARPMIRASRSLKTRSPDSTATL